MTRTESRRPVRPLGCKLPSTQLTVPLPSRVDERIAARVEPAAGSPQPNPDRFLLSLERCELIDSRPGQHVLLDYTQRSLTLFSLSLSINTLHRAAADDRYFPWWFDPFIHSRTVCFVPLVTKKKTSSTLHFFVHPRSKTTWGRMLLVPNSILRFSSTSLSLSLCSFGCWIEPVGRDRFDDWIFPIKERKKKGILNAESYTKGTSNENARQISPLKRDGKRKLVQDQHRELEREKRSIVVWWIGWLGPNGGLWAGDSSVSAVRWLHTEKVMRQIRQKITDSELLETKGKSSRYRVHAGKVRKGIPLTK